MKEPEDGEQIWTRQKGEPHGAYSHFTVYRSLGHDRTLRQASEKLKLSLARMRHLSSRWDWVSRATAYDDWTLVQEQKFETVDRNAMKRRHISMSMAVQSKIVRRLNSLTESELNKLPFSVLIYGLDVSQRLEREARGEPENPGGVAKVEFVVHAPTEPIPLDPNKDNSQHHNLPTPLSR
jgi:hypothetical protein